MDNLTKEFLERAQYYQSVSALKWFLCPSFVSKTDLSIIAKFSKFRCYKNWFDRSVKRDSRVRLLSVVVTNVSTTLSLLKTSAQVVETSVTPSNCSLPYVKSQPNY